MDELHNVLSSAGVHIVATFRRGTGDDMIRLIIPREADDVDDVQLERRLDKSGARISGIDISPSGNDPASMSVRFTLPNFQVEVTSTNADLY